MRYMLLYYNDNFTITCNNIVQQKIQRSVKPNFHQLLYSITVKNSNYSISNFHQVFTCHFSINTKF